MGLIRQQKAINLLLMVKISKNQIQLNTIQAQLALITRKHSTQTAHLYQQLPLMSVLMIPFYYVVFLKEKNRISRLVKRNRKLRVIVVSPYYGTYDFVRCKLLLLLLLLLLFIQVQVVDAPQLKGKQDGLFKFETLFSSLKITNVKS